jgi:hypothetical protein
MKWRKLYLFKKKDRSLEGTERKDQGNPFLESVWAPLCSGEVVDFFIFDLAFHGDDDSCSFQERQTQGEKGLKIGESS